MKQSIQDKIEQIKLLAKSQVENKALYNDSTDSLLKVIRNKEEANLFMAELDAAINISKSK